MPGSSFATPITVDMRGLGRLSSALRKASPALAKELRLALKVIGEGVAAEARSRASSWSTRVPGSVKAAASGSRVAVRAGGPKAPHAPAYENAGKPGVFRHPVFGNRDKWVPQLARPFLGPALEAKGAEIGAAVDAAVDHVLGGV